MLTKNANYKLAFFRNKNSHRLWRGSATGGKRCAYTTVLLNPACPAIAVAEGGGKTPYF